MTPYIRPALPADVEYLARRMKRADVEEVNASHGHTPLEAMRISFETSDMAGTVCDRDGEPVLMYGVGLYVSPDTGCPWMLSTDAIFRPRMRWFFLKGTAAVINRMHARFPILIQHIDARHSHSLAWLRWAGFSFDALLPEWGVSRRPFFRMSRIKEHVANAPVFQMRPE